MSNPSFSNIDLWLFELAEGNLSPSQIEQLEMFLLKHPELDVERDMWEMAKMQAAPIAYPDQEKLRRRFPVAWYLTGAVSISVLLLFGWHFLSGSEIRSERQLTQHYGEASSTRVFVKNSTGTSTGDSFEEDITALIANNRMNNPLAPTNGSPQDQSSNTNVQDIQFDPTETAALTVESNEVQANHTVQGSASENGGSRMFINSMFTSSAAPVMLGVVNDLEKRGIEFYELSDMEPVELLVNEPYSLDVLDKDDYLLAEGRSERPKSTYGTHSTEYKSSFKSKLKGFGRQLQRMMDNPIALKNFRDPSFHVPGMLPNDVNFGATGTMLSTRIQTMSRLQWYGQENELFQNQVSVDGYAYGLRGGLGIQVNHTMYKDGGVNVSSAAITYSPKFSISRSISVEPSLRFKMGYNALTASKMQNVEQVELERGNTHAFYPEGEPIGKGLWYQDLGAGLMVNTEWFFAGVNFDNILRHKDNIYQMDYNDPRRAGHHFVATIGTDWVSRKETLGLSPYIVYQKKEKLSEAWLGANFRWDWFTVGAAMSTNMDPAASIGLKFDRFALSYNADYLQSSMTGNRSLSHQLTLRFVSKPSRLGRKILSL